MSEPMPVAVEIHDHRHVHAHLFQHRLERRRPVVAMLHRLNRVCVMPVRREGLISIQRDEAVAMRVRQHRIEHCDGRPVVHQQKQV